MTKTTIPNKQHGGRPLSYDPALVYTIISKGLAEGIPALELDTAYVKEKLIKKTGRKFSGRPEVLEGHVAAAHAEIVEEENRKLLAALPEGTATAVDRTVAAAGKNLMLLVARQHQVSQQQAEKVCDELRADKRNAQHRVFELEGELEKERAAQKSLKDERNALIEDLTRTQEELRVARSDLERVNAQPSNIEHLLAELRKPEVRNDIRAALSVITSDPAAPTE